MNALVRSRSLNLFSLTRTALRSQPRTFHLLRPFCSEPEEDAEKQDFKDKYMRSLADMENLRKRSQKQVDDTKIFAVQSFCKDLLEVADVLDMALEATAYKKESNDQRCAPQNFAKHDWFQSTLMVIHSIQVHDALFEIPHHQTDVKPGHVAQVMKIGYSLHNRPIRPAKVAVVKELDE
uniref:GrpE protein homolog n=1 Tax=Ditylenchus dipsaci TaxID=166011 RepID=A0A915EQ03_9BILA